MCVEGILTRNDDVTALIPCSVYLEEEEEEELREISFCVLPSERERESERLCEFTSAEVLGMEASRPRGCLLLLLAAKMEAAASERLLRRRLAAGWFCSRAVCRSQM